MRHYCTYFDSGFLAQGLALWRSLALWDAEAVLWVLAIDEQTFAFIQQLGEVGLRPLRLLELEENDAELKHAQQNRTRVEYYFTLSPSWPRWLLSIHQEIDKLTYLDADLFFFSNPAPIFEEMDAKEASVLIVEHRFPAWLKHYEKHGLYNVGILSFRNDSVGQEVLNDWRAKCIEWCHDRLEEGKYADQKYLEDWCINFGPKVCVLAHPGVNLAPWNWAAQHFEFKNGDLKVNAQALIVFHFARFRPIWGSWLWQSGQLDYGIMPFRLRCALYGPYWRALCSARKEIAISHVHVSHARRASRFDRAFWKSMMLRLIFGSDWIRIGDCFLSGRFGLGRYSGRLISRLRKMFFLR